MFGFGKKKDKNITEQQVLEALRTVRASIRERDLASENRVRSVQIEGLEVRVRLALPAIGGDNQEQVERAVREAIRSMTEAETVEVHFEETARDGGQAMYTGAPLRSVVAVASGKGGVGKSTVSVNLAIALARQGARVGLLDADIYGPNIPMMMGAGQLPPPVGNRIYPTEAYGVKLISMGFLVKPDQPVIWRGPMLHNALRQFIQDVEWGDLDYLILDLPPGTGDVQMSIAQTAELTGGIIVTTPQDVALSDARKGLATFQRLSVPILGIIENMSYFVAPDTGRRYDIFGHGGGKRYASESGIPFLGEVAIDPRIATGGDTGKPILVAAPESAPARAMQAIAEQVAASVRELVRNRKPEGLIGLGDIPIVPS